MSFRSFPRLMVPLLIAAPAFAIGFGVSAAATTPAPTYYACLHSGTLSKVSSTFHTCVSPSKLITWNSVGPQGIQGKKGDTGPQGPGAQSGATGVSIPLTHGDWSVTVTAAPGVSCGSLSTSGIVVADDISGFAPSTAVQTGSALVQVTGSTGSILAGCSGAAIVTATPTVIH